jgi:hypothetical protein
MIFYLVLAITTAWAARSIAVGIHQMKASDTQASEFAAYKAGDHAKAVVQIFENVDGSLISGILLRRKTDA